MLRSASKVMICFLLSHLFTSLAGEKSSSFCVSECQIPRAPHPFPEGRTPGPCCGRFDWRKSRRCKQDSGRREKGQSKPSTVNHCHPTLYLSSPIRNIFVNVNFPNEDVLHDLNVFQLAAYCFII